jgi:hypothetical protein
MRLSYLAFSVLDADLKQICTDWQVTERDGHQVPNDHLDAEYDADVVHRLAALDASALPLLAGMAAGLPRMHGYAPRLMRARARVEAGERNAFCRPQSESYHDVWMELHEDLLVTLRMSRGASYC